MASAQNTGSDREAALRRVAIVLSSLPPSAASLLLGCVEPESKQRLRRTMATLVDVDPLERQRALQAFKGSFENHPSTRPPRNDLSSSDSNDLASGVADEISISSQQRSEAAPKPASRVVSNRVTSGEGVQQSTFSFLREVNDQTMVNLLRGEHPQTIALVLASIAADQAARLLPRLDANLQSEALSRIGRLGKIPDDVAREIATHLKQRVGQLEESARSETGIRALHAILAAMPTAAGPDRPSLDSQRSEPSAPARPTTQPPAGSQTPPASPPPETNGFSTSDLSAVDQTHRLRLVADTEFDDTLPGSRQVDDQQTETLSTPPSTPQPQDFHDRPKVGFASTDAIHQHLIDLSPDTLCIALGKVSTRQAMLALCGLPNEIGEAALALLPRNDARQVRRGIASLQSLELREIDAAKEAVAVASIQPDEEEEQGETGSAAPQAVRMAA